MFDRIRLAMKNATSSGNCTLAACALPMRMAAQVSTSGGRVPTWSPRRNELFYLSPDSHLMVVSYSVDANTFRANPPQKWSEHQINDRPTTRPFDVHPEGDRFVVSGDVANIPNVNKVVLVPNFVDEVRRRLADATR